MKRLIYIATIPILFVLMGCPGAIDNMAWKQLSGGYIYHEPAGQPFIEKEHSAKGIPSWIFDYNFNQEFIIALSKELSLTDSAENELFKSGKFYEYVNEKGISEYWIIAHKNDSIYGPYNKETYILQRKILGVPGVLQLNEY